MADFKLGKGQKPVEVALYKLDHIKHSFIEKDDTMTVQIYVKGVKKDTVELNLTEQSIFLYFSTMNSQFLDLYRNSTSDTLFCWEVNLKHTIVPEKRRYKLSSSVIEITLSKEISRRWGVLMAPLIAPLMATLSKGRENASEVCGPCGVNHMSTVPTYWCTSCEEGLCENCYKYHRLIKTSRNHTTIVLRKFLNMKSFISSIYTVCKTHESPLELYCPNHDAPCCSNCASVDHSDCIGLKSIQNVVTTFKNSDYLNDIDGRFEVLVNNIDKIQENRLRNKREIVEQSDKSRSDIKIIRNEINAHLDKLESYLSIKSDEIVEAEKENLDRLLKKLYDEKTKMCELRKNFSELKTVGSDLQVYMSSRKVDEITHAAEEKVKSLTDSERMFDSSLQFKLQPNIKEKLFELVDVFLKKEKCSITLESSDLNYRCFQVDSA